MLLTYMFSYILIGMGWSKRSPRKSRTKRGQGKESIVFCSCSTKALFSNVAKLC